MIPLCIRKNLPWIQSCSLFLSRFSSATKPLKPFLYFVVISRNDFVSHSTKKGVEANGYAITHNNRHVCDSLLTAHVEPHSTNWFFPNPFLFHDGPLYGLLWSACRVPCNGRFSSTAFSTDSESSLLEKPSLLTEMGKPSSTYSFKQYAFIMCALEGFYCCICIIIGVKFIECDEYVLYLEQTWGRFEIFTLKK